MKAALASFIAMPIIQDSLPDYLPFKAGFGNVDLALKSFRTRMSNWLLQQKGKYGK